MRCYIYRLFDSVSSVMLAARKIRKAEFRCKIVPIPREFSSDCGVCLRTFGEEETSIADILTGTGTFPAMIHRKDVG